MKPIDTNPQPNESVDRIAADERYFQFPRFGPPQSLTFFH